MEAVNFGPDYSLLHAMAVSWMSEGDCLVWLTSVPGDNIFGSQVVFVNGRVLQELQWSFAEWEDGTAPAAVFRPDEAARIKLCLDAKSKLPLLAHVRKKTTPPNQDGDDYVLHFRYDLPHDLRLTVGVPG
jgi:hypothetical protein